MPTPREITRAALKAAAYETWLAAQQPQPELSDPERLPPPAIVPTDEPVLTVAQICTLRGVTPHAVLDLIHRGILPATKSYRPDPANPKATVTYLVRQSDYDHWVRHPYRVPHFPRRVAVEKRERANGFVTMSDARRMLGVTRTRLDHICRRKTNPLPRQKIDGVWFIRRVDAQCEVDSRTLRALEKMPQSD